MQRSRRGSDQRVLRAGRSALFSGGRAAGHLCWRHSDRHRVGECGPQPRLDLDHRPHHCRCAAARSRDRMDALQAEAGSAPARRRVVHLLAARADHRDTRLLFVPAVHHRTTLARDRRLRLSRARLSHDTAAREAVGVMKITAAESFVLKVPVGNAIADSMQFVTHLEFAGLTIATDAGISGTGYTMTVGHGGRVVQVALDSLFIDDLLGEDPRNVRQIWQQLYFGKSHWIGRAGATTMAQAAIDIALWDINAKAAELPLWQLLGGAREADIPIYNTHAGWLNYSIDQLTDEALKLVGHGYTALKMKVGRADSREDRGRVSAVRKAIGDGALLMVDANQKWDLMQACHAARLLEEFDLSWLEEPLHPDDIRSHQILNERSEERRVG